MERKIGEIFEYKGEWYQCVLNEDKQMRHCYNCHIAECASGDLCREFGKCGYYQRSDGKNVFYKKLEKVGELYEHCGKLYQCYKLPMEIEIRLLPNNCNPIGKDNLVEIEIKQNEEDMEEKGQCCDNRFEIIAKAKEALLKETNIARDEKEMAVIDNILFRCWQMGWLDKYDDTEHSNSEKIGKNLKPFDFQKAIEGKPVCTRDGRKARIICFDRKGIYSIVALIDGEQENIQSYTNNGRLRCTDLESELDLMMLPEKHEGWINVIKNQDNYYYCKGVFDTEEYARNNEANYPGLAVATAKIEWEE